MAIFDDVVVNAKSAAAAVSKKAGEIYDLSKLRISLASLRSELNKQYQVLGEAVFNSEPEAAEDTAEQITEQNFVNKSEHLDDYHTDSQDSRALQKCL